MNIEVTPRSGGAVKFALVCVLIVIVISIGLGLLLANSEWANPTIGRSRARQLDAQTERLRIENEQLLRQMEHELLEQELAVRQRMQNDQYYQGVVEFAVLVLLAMLAAFLMLFGVNLMRTPPRNEPNSSGKQAPAPSGKIPPPRHLPPSHTFQNMPHNSPNGGPHALSQTIFINCDEPHPNFAQPFMSTTSSRNGSSSGHTPMPGASVK